MYRVDERERIIMFQINCDVICTYGLSLSQCIASPSH